MQSRRKYWEEKVEEWQATDLGQNQFCRDKGLRSDQFRYWLKKFATKCEDPRPPSAAKEAAVRFLEVESKPQAVEKPIVVSAKQEPAIKFLETDCKSQSYQSRVLRITTSYGSLIEVPL